MCLAGHRQIQHYRSYSCLKFLRHSVTTGIPRSKATTCWAKTGTLLPLAVTVGQKPRHSHQRYFKLTTSQFILWRSILILSSHRLGREFNKLCIASTLCPPSVTLPPLLSRQFGDQKQNVILKTGKAAELTLRGTSTMCDLGNRVLWDVILRHDA
jgi:hypothetical protein